MGCPALDCPNRTGRRRTRTAESVINPLFLAAAAAARRRRAEVGRPGAPSLLRLVLAEIAEAVRESYHPAKYAVAAAASVGTGILLGPRTPGPVLGAGWRLTMAVLLGFVGLNAVQVLLSRRREDSEDDLVYLLRMGVAVVGLLLIATFVIAFLLAVVTGTAASGPATDTLGLQLQVDAGVLIGAGLLLVAVIASGVSRRVPVPTSMVFLAIGMALGSEGIGLVSLDDPQLVQGIGMVALIIILFDGGLATPANELRLGLGPGLAMATVGVAVTAGVTALGAGMLLDVPTREAWLIGAIVASTDAGAVSSLLARTKLPRRLSSILHVESGLNDPVAILLTAGLLAAWEVPPSASSWVTFGAAQLLGGLLVGVAVGWAGGWVMRHAPLASSGLYPILGLAIAGVAYGTAAAVGGSGLLATYLAGIVLAGEAPRRRAAVRALTDALTSGVEVGLFLLLGLLVFPSRLPEVAAVSAGVAFLLVFVARPLAVATTLSWFDFSRRELTAVAWLGLRGAVPIVLGTLAFSAGIEPAETIFNVVLFVVIVSSLLQGTTASSLVRRLGLQQEAGSGHNPAQATPLDDIAVDIVEIEIAVGSSLAGQMLRSVPPPADAVVVALVRDDVVQIPTGTTLLAAGDILVLATSDQQDGMADIDRWVTS